MFLGVEAIKEGLKMHRKRIRFTGQMLLAALATVVRLLRRLVFGFFPAHGLFETADSFSQTFSEFRKFLRAKHQHSDRKDYQQMHWLQ
jgi:hypothetical protein